MDITTDIMMFTPEEQLTRKQQMKLRRAVADADIPMMMLFGWGIGFLITGILWITLGVFIEACKIWHRLIDDWNGGTNEPMLPYDLEMPDYSRLSGAMYDNTIK